MYSAISIIVVENYCKSDKFLNVFLSVKSNNQIFFLDPRIGVVSVDACASLVMADSAKKEKIAAAKKKVNIVKNPICEAL